MISLNVLCRSIIYSYLMLVAKHVTCEEFSQCYSDVNICLWTDGSLLTQSAAKTACQRRSNSFLPRVTDANIQHKLDLFRSDTNSSMRQVSLGNNGFWIDVRSVGVNPWHWINSSSFAGEVRDQTGGTKERFAVILYDVNSRKFVFSAREWNNRSSSYICQLRQGANCAASDLSMNSKCYRKFHNSSSLTWFSASNDCLSRGGSLAVFTDIGRPLRKSQVTQWLNTSGTDKTYWIGLVRSWWQTTNRDIQYSNWEERAGHPNTNHICVIVKGGNYWNTFDCNVIQRFVCQNYTGSTPIPTTKRTTAVRMSTKSTNSQSDYSLNNSVITQTTPLKPKPQTNDESSSGLSGTTIGVAIGVPVAVVIVIGVIVVVILLLWKKRMQAAGRYGHPTSNGNAIKEQTVYASILEAVPEANRAAPSDFNQADRDAVIYSELQSSTST